MSKTHHSQSGPVKVIATFEPTPPSKAEQLQRLRHKLALIEDRIADNRSFRPTPFRYGVNAASNHLNNLLRNREQTQAEIALLESGEP